MSQRIFLSPPHLGPDEADLMARAMAEGYIAPVGPDLDAFEREFAARVSTRERPLHCAALNSGTAALHLALILTGVGPGDIVLCSDLTFAASINPARYLGATPVFVDSDPRTWNLDPALVRDYLAQAREQGKTVKALVAVDLYGLPADLEALAKLCEEFDVTLIEDAAESLGGTLKGKPCGGFGRFGVFSFNGNKILTTSGGGMLACAQEDDAALARNLAAQARDEAPHYEHSRLGYNYRLSNLLATVGRGQLRVLDERLKQKRAIFEGYRERLASLPGLRFQEEPQDLVSNHWLTCVLFPGERETAFQTRERVRLALDAENIESRPLWKPMSLQPLYQNATLARGQKHVAQDLFARGLCLPSGTRLTEADLDRICAIVKQAAREGAA